MTLFVTNLALAAIWSMLWGDITLFNMGTGFILAYLILYRFKGVLSSDRYFRKLYYVIYFLVFVAAEIIKANIDVMKLILSPRHHNKPGIIAIPLDAKSDLEITLLANLITLTPGTLSLDVSNDRGTLFVHSMFLDSVESSRETIKNGLERRVLELMR